MAKPRKPKKPSVKAEKGADVVSETGKTSATDAELDVSNAKSQETLADSVGEEISSATTQSDAQPDDVAQDIVDDTLSESDPVETDKVVDVELEPIVETPEGVETEQVAADTLDENEALTEASSDKDETDAGSEPGEQAADADKAEEADHRDTIEAEIEAVDDKPWRAPSEDAPDAADKQVTEDASQLKEVTTPAPVIEYRQGSAWPAIFGGIIAAVIGFIAGRGDTLDQYLPASMQREVVDITAIETETAELSSENAEQADRLAALEAVDIEALAGAISSLEGASSSLESSVEALAARVVEVENRPATVKEIQFQEDIASSDDVVALQSALDAQREELAALAARAEEAEANAASEAARILARAALTRVVTAVDSGQTYAPALSDLEEVTPVAIPDALSAAAAEGVPTINALRESFPEAARAALSAARSEVPESDVATVAGFLKRQLSARSVSPREGDDPDAVLSRAEAAVKSGNLDVALTELDALPETARAAMDDWLQAASARKAAQDAAQELADSLNSN